MTITYIVQNHYEKFVSNESYLTIRLLALVFYEQIVNEAAPRWLSLVENEGE